MEEQITHAYLVVKPCGCVVEICVDGPPYAKSIARMARYATTKGFSLQHMTMEEARQSASRLTKAYAACDHDGAPKPDTSDQLPLFETGVTGS